MKTLTKISNDLGLLPNQLERSEDLFGARCSGKTYAMLAQAVYWAQFSNVYILGANYRHTISLWAEFDGIAKRLGIDTRRLKRSGCAIGRESQLMSLDCPILIDHYRVEITFQDAIALLLALEKSLPIKVQRHILNRLYHPVRLYAGLSYRTSRGRAVAERKVSATI